MKRSMLIVVVLVAVMVAPRIAPAAGGLVPSSYLPQVGKALQATMTATSTIRPSPTGSPTRTPTPTATATPSAGTIGPIHFGVFFEPGDGADLDREMPYLPFTVERVWLFVDFERIEPGTTMFARWYRETEMVRETPLITFADRIDERHRVEIEGLSGDPRLPFGDYRVEFYLNGTLVRREMFVVE